MEKSNVVYLKPMVTIRWHLTEEPVVLVTHKRKSFNFKKTGVK